VHQTFVITSTNSDYRPEVSQDACGADLG
jgi:hypothetical protein